LSLFKGLQGQGTESLVGFKGEALNISYSLKGDGLCPPPFLTNIANKRNKRRTMSAAQRAKNVGLRPKVFRSLRRATRALPLTH